MSLQTSSLRWLVPIVVAAVIVITVVTDLTAASTLRVKKLEVGEAVSKFQEIRSSYEEGERLESSLELAPAQTQLILPLGKQLSCLPGR